MEASGAVGELLIAQPFLFRLNGPVWIGPGSPSLVDLVLPPNPGLIGRRLYVQGVLTGPGRAGATGALALVLGLWAGVPPPPRSGN